MRADLGHLRRARARRPRRRRRPSRRRRRRPCGPPRAGRARGAPQADSAAAGTPRRSAGAPAARCPRPAIRSTESHRLPVHHEVHVDARLRPEEQAGQVGDRRDRRAVDRAACGADARARRSRRDRSRRSRRGRVRRSCAPAGASRTGTAAARASPADRRDVLEQPVDDRVGPGHEAQLHAVAVLDDRRSSAPHRREPVDHASPRPAAAEASICSRQRARGGGVPLAHVGGQDQHALRARAPARAAVCVGGVACG